MIRSRVTFAMMLAAAMESGRVLVWSRYRAEPASVLRGDVPAFDEAFSYACPKFITPSPPSFDNPAGLLDGKAVPLPYIDGLLDGYSIRLSF